MNKLVSIIIPTFGTNDSLKRAIDSVLNQSYKNIEIIVVDDNGENTKSNLVAKQIMSNYKNHKKIKYVEHKKNKNGSAARNTGFKNSSGEYIGFLDDDDVFYEDKIEKQVKFIEKEKCDMCTCFYKKNNKVIKFDNKNILYNIFMLNDTPQTSSFLMTKKMFTKLNGFDETYNRHQDYEFLIRALEVGIVKVLNECLYERIDNGVNNIPNGKKMEEIKDKFLCQFDYIIKKYKYSKLKIYGKNYGYVSFLYIKQKKLLSAFRVIIRKGNVLSLYYLINRIKIAICNKIKK